MSATHTRGMEKIQVAKDECPTAPAPRVTVYTRVLHRACQIVGGVDHLAKHLRVSPPLLYSWLEGDDVPPSNIFLHAVDLVLPTWGPQDDALARAISANKPKRN